MTVICAAIKNGVVAISSDTQTQFGSITATARHKRNSNKLHSVNGSVIGLAGWSAIFDIVGHLILNDKDLFRLNSCTEIFSALMEIHERIKKDYYVETKEDDDQPVESSQMNALIVNRNGLFEISSYREVNQYKTFWAIGSGKRFALGAMQALYKENKTAKEIVEAGVRAAAEFDDGCGLPLNTKTIKIGK